MPIERICDACGKSKKLSEGKTCDNSHFICKQCRYNGVLSNDKTTCPLCKTKLK
jgi:rubrerythrin